MKKNKLKLKDLKVQSFKTSNEIRGGYNPTQDCPTEPVTLLGQGEFGFCKAYTDNTHCVFC